MDSQEQQKAVARAEFEKIRIGVRLAPPPSIDGAPAWLHSVEEMREFFNATANVWDRVFGIEQKDPLYEAVAAQIAATDSAVQILLLGCGTGLELAEIFAKAPHAHVTGIDLAPNMKLPGGAQAAWNYDVTLSPETQRQLLHVAGFSTVHLPWQSPDQDLVVFVAEK